MIERLGHTSHSTPIEVFPGVHRRRRDGGRKSLGYSFQRELQEKLLCSYIALIIFFLYITLMVESLYLRGPLLPI